MGTLIDPIGPQPRCLGTTMLPPLGLCGLIIALPPGMQHCFLLTILARKGMQLQGLQCICPTLTILVADGSFQLYTQS